MRVDYLTVTWYLPDQDADLDVAVYLEGAMRWMVGQAWGEASWSKRGMFGYSRTLKFERGGAVLAWGGNNKTVMLTMPGEACALVRSWTRVIRLLRDRLGARITRWDAAADDYSGEQSVDRAADLWLLDRFKGQGRPPTMKQAGNWMAPDGKGRTLYVGSRTSGKVCRVYEKGKQMGNPLDPWTRWEVELHRSRYVEIPWEAVVNPRSYLAGQYPCMAWVARGGRIDRIKAAAREGLVAVSRLIQCASTAYGKLHAMLHAHGMTKEQVFDAIQRAGTPKRVQVAEVVRSWGIARYTNAAMEWVARNDPWQAPLPDGLLKPVEV